MPTATHKHNDAVKVLERLEGWEYNSSTREWRFNGESVPEIVRQLCKGDIYADKELERQFYEGLWWLT